MAKTPRRLIALLLLLIAALWLGACTRPATTQTLPTEASGDPNTGGVDIAATEAAIQAMQAILSAGQTHTAEAALGIGGGGETAIAETATPLPTNTPAPTATPEGPRTYTVQSGDWLYQIARNHNVDPKDLIAANPQINPNAVLQPGTVINIPAAGSSVPVPGATTTGQRTYVVKSGDNLFRIALNHNVDYQTLAQLNNIAAPYTVFPGQVLVLP